MPPLHVPDDINKIKNIPSNIGGLHTPQNNDFNDISSNVINKDIIVQKHEGTFHWMFSLYWDHFFIINGSILSLIIVMFIYKTIKDIRTKKRNKVDTMRINTLNQKITLEGE